MCENQWLSKVKMSGNVMRDEWGWGKFEFYVKFEK